MLSFLKKSPFLRVHKLQQLIDVADGLTYDRTTQSNRAAKYIRTNGACGQLVTALNAAGVKKLKLLGHGDNAILVEDEHGFVFRLRGGPSSHPSTFAPPDISQIIFPYTHIDTQSSVSIVGVPKCETLQDRLKTGRITPDQAEIVMLALRIGATQNDDPCLFWDWKNSVGIKFDQVGFLHDDTPIILDMGSVTSLQALLDYTIGNSNHDSLKNDYENLSAQSVPETPFLSWDRSWIDSDRKPKNRVFADRERLRFEQKYPSVRR